MYMNIKNCKKCGKIYSYDGFDNCYACRNEENDMYQKVREYIYDNSNADINKVSQATEVPKKKILEFLRQGKLEIKEGSNLILDCERCEKPITSGRFCDKCVNEMDRELKGVLREDKLKKEEEQRYRNANKLNVKNRR